MNLIKSLRRFVIVWIWNHTPNCTEMSRLTSQSLDAPLSLKLRVQMRLHHLICVWCQRYFQHLHFLHQAAPRLESAFTTFSARGLPPEARRRIVLNLRLAADSTFL